MIEHGNSTISEMQTVLYPPYISSCNPILLSSNGNFISWNDKQFLTLHLTPLLPDERIQKNHHAGKIGQRYPILHVSTVYVNG